MVGFYQTFEIRPDPNLLNSNAISMEELFHAIEMNNAATGGGYVVHHGEQRFLRGQALVNTPDDIRKIVLRREEDGTPILVGDVADVSIAPMTRQEPSHETRAEKP